ERGARGRHPGDDRESGPPRDDCGEALSLVNDLMTRVRDLSMNLRPAMLDDLGLLPALFWHLERYSTQTGVRVDFRHSGLERRLSAQTWPGGGTRLIAELPLAGGADAGAEP